MPKHENEYYENLSAMVDGENGRAESARVDRMLDDIRDVDIDRQAWQAWHLARDVMQKDYSPALPTDFWAQVSRRIDLEETYSMDVADMHMHDNSVRDVPARGANVLPFAKRTRSHSSAEISSAEISGLANSNRRWKSVAALGMAASVALAAVVTAQLFNSQNSQTGVATAGGPKIARLAPGSSTVEPITITSGVVPAVLTEGGTHWRSDEKRRAVKVEQQLNSYLTNHLENSSVGGMISHSRIVGYDTSVLRSESF